MTPQEKIKFYTERYIDIVALAIKENIDALRAGRIALDLLGCPDNVAEAIEKSMIEKINA